MNAYLHKKIICDNVIPTGAPQQILNNVIVRSDKNSELLYIDGAAESQTPIYLGLTKSAGTQDAKLPVAAGDILGGVQMYARVKEGTSLGYNHEQTPLCGSIMFRVADDYTSGIASTELLIALTNTDLTVQLVLDSNGNLQVAGNVSTGELVITDEEVVADKVVKFVKAIYQGTEYAIPLYSVQGK